MINLIYSANDARDLLESTVFHVRVYTGMTKSCTKMHITKYSWACRLRQLEKSALALANDEHALKSEDTKSLSSTFQYHMRLYWEATEIYKHCNNINRKKQDYNWIRFGIKCCLILGTLVQNNTSTPQLHSK